MYCSNKPTIHALQMKLEAGSLGKKREPLSTFNSTERKKINFDTELLQIEMSFREVGVYAQFRLAVIAAYFPIKYLSC